MGWGTWGGFSAVLIVALVFFGAEMDRREQTGIAAPDVRSSRNAFARPDPPPVSAAAVAGIDQVGYLRDGGEHRVFTFSFAPGLSAAEIHAHAEGLPLTPGRAVAAYYYPKGSHIPGDEVTHARDFVHAADVIYEMPGMSHWRYAFMRPLIGDVQFVDCVRDPKNGLCHP